MAALQNRFTNELMKEIVPLRGEELPRRGRPGAPGDRGPVDGRRPDAPGRDQPIPISSPMWPSGVPASARTPRIGRAATRRSWTTPKINQWIKLFSISVGDKDFTLAGSKALSEVLTKHGIKNQLHISGGGHTWINWRHYLNDLVPLLFGGGRPRTSARQASSPTGRGSAPKGFDARRDGIERGKLETVEYDSKTVGVKRKMVVYTPPGYPRTPSTRSCTCCTASATTRRAGRRRASAERDPGQPLRRQEARPDDRGDAQRPGVGRAAPGQPVRRAIHSRPTRPSSRICSRTSSPTSSRITRCRPTASTGAGGPVDGRRPVAELRPEAPGDVRLGRRLLLGPQHQAGRSN